MRDIEHDGGSPGQRQLERRVREVISTKIEFNLESSSYSGDAVSADVQVQVQDDEAQPEQRPTVRFVE